MNITIDGVDFEINTDGSRIPPEWARAFFLAAFEEGADMANVPKRYKPAVFILICVAFNAGTDPEVAGMVAAQELKRALLAEN